jgi:TPR repeat protein
MINRLSEGSAREDFLEQLNGFYTTCGRPHYKEIVEISERLDDLYPLKGDRKRDLPTLSASGISEVLAGRRKNLPSAGWLAAFVLSCQRRAWELGAYGEDPGVATLPDWQRRLTEAERAMGNSGGGTKRLATRSGDQSERPPGPMAPPSGGPAGRPARRRTSDRGVDRPSGQTGDRAPDQPSGPPREPPPDQPSEPPDSPTGHLARLPSGRGGGTGTVIRTGNTVRAAAVPGGWVAAAPAQAQAAASAAAGNADVARSAVPVRLPAALREYLAWYGSYGSGLLADAQAGVIDAVYRVAVLLLGAESVDGDAEAQRLLIYAGAAGHRDALALLDANPVPLDRLDAASHAYELAEAAAADDGWAAALAFYECAARGGLPAASLELADRLLGQGDEEQAVRWLAVAARQGDIRAEIRLEQLRRVGRIPPTSRIPAPAPAAAHAADGTRGAAATGG